MLKKLQDVLVAEARLCLQRLNGAKEPMEVAVAFAKYSQAVHSARLVGQTWYQRDKESEAAYLENTSKIVGQMETEEILRPDITLEGGEKS